MKKVKVLLSLLLYAIISTASGCEPDPEPTIESEDQFADLYGYWLNSDKSGAMEIVEYSSYYCKINYFVYTSNGIKNNESYYGEYDSSFGALTPDGKYTVSVEIASRSINNLVLKDFGSQGNHLSSYTFSRATKSDFYKYLEGTNSEKDDNKEDVSKLIGTWKGYNGTPGYESTDEYTITFYANGRATETIRNQDYSETLTGTYKYSNGAITEWLEDGSILANEIGPCPWFVTFNSSTSITITVSGYEMTFTKQ